MLALVRLGGLGRSHRQLLAHCYGIEGLGVPGYGRGATRSQETKVAEPAETGRDWQGSGRLLFGCDGSDRLGNFDRVLHLGRWDFVGVTLGSLRVKLVVYLFANKFCTYVRLIKY